MAVHGINQFPIGVGIEQSLAEHDIREMAQGSPAPFMRILAEDVNLDLLGNLESGGIVNGNDEMVVSPYHRIARVTGFHERLFVTASHIIRAVFQLEGLESRRRCIVDQSTVDGIMEQAFPFGTGIVNIVFNAILDSCIGGSRNHELTGIAYRLQESPRSLPVFLEDFPVLIDPAYA